jgi:Tfp pilus assembly protein PilO
MKQMKVSAVVALAVTVLAVVTAFAFSFANMSYQAELAKLKKINAEYQRTLESYKAVLDNIRMQLEQARPVVVK